MVGLLANVWPRAPAEVRLAQQRATLTHVLEQVPNDAHLLAIVPDQHTVTAQARQEAARLNYNVRRVIQPNSAVGRLTRDPYSYMSFIPSEVRN